MEDEIDLRPYIHSLIRYWRQIALCALIGAGLGLFYGVSRQDSYPATTIVAFLEPTQAVQFDPRFESVTSKTTILKSLPALSMSDEVMGALLLRLDDTGIDTVTDLKKRLSAESGSDLNLLYLRARTLDPVLSARLVNEWADVFVTMANDIYANRGSGQVEFYTVQLQEAAQRLTATDQALIDFQAINTLPQVTNELDSLVALQVRYVELDNSLTMLESDVQAARAQLTSLPTGAGGVAGEYTLLALQSRVFQLQEQLPVTIQLAAPTGAASPDTGQFLSSLDAVIAEMRPEIAEQLVSLGPRILELQREKESLTARSVLLSSNRDLAMETYKTLARKLDEERLTTNDITTGFRQVSRAAVPEMPVTVNLALITLAGAAFGMILSGLAAILYTWWRR